MLVAEAEGVKSDIRKAEEDVRMEERQSRTCSGLPEMVFVPCWTGAGHLVGSRR